MASLHGFIYLSKLLLDLDESHLYELSESASHNNQLLGVTGFLYFEEGYFLQYIEGKKEVVINLMNIIESDPRHQVVYKHDILIQEKKFPSWNMKFVDPYQAKAINIENLLMEILKMMKEPEVFNSAYKEKMILQMIDRLSLYREKLSLSM